jgi:putative phosphoesterase
MKLAFISDIHGNALALEKVILHISMNHVDKIYVLGDISYRGPEPKRSIALIRSLKTEVIKGNADEWVVRGLRKDEVPDKVLDMMNRERDWTVDQLDQADIDYLENLPIALNAVIEGITLHMFHATPESLFEMVLPYEDDELIKSKLMASKEEAQIYIYGHIHKPFIRYLNGKVIINTGSVGLPFDGLAMASYATVEIADGNIKTTIERVGYDVEKVVEQYINVQYPNAETMIKVIRNASI